MVDKIRIELNHAEAGRLLKETSSAMIAAKCAAIAAAATANARGNAVFGHSTVIGRNRVHGMVWTENFEAMWAEAKHRALTRAIDAGRG